MAASVQQPTNEEQAFWQLFLDTHAKVRFLWNVLLLLGRGIGRFLDFVFNGHILVAFVRWMLRVSGYSAESALLVAIVWISICSVGSGIVEIFLSAKDMSSTISFAVIVLAIIPELILMNALCSLIDHWLRAIQGGYQNRIATVASWAWAIAFTIPTALFIYLTAVTLSQLHESGNFMQATTSMINLRCYAGWSYGILETIYAMSSIGKRMMHTVQPMQLNVTPAQPIAPVVPTPEPIDYEELAAQLLPLLRTDLQALIPAPQVIDYQSVAQQIETRITTVVEERLTNLLPSPRIKNAPQHATVDATPARRITQQLNELDATTNATKSPVRVARLGAPKSATTSAPTSRQKALKILARTPDIDATTLARKAEITASYARKIIAEQKGN
jgi:hypothetical protein